MCALQPGPAFGCTPPASPVQPPVALQRKAASSPPRPRRATPTSGTSSAPLGSRWEAGPASRGGEGGKGRGGILAGATDQPTPDSKASSSSAPAAGSRPDSKPCPSALPCPAVPAAAHEACGAQAQRALRRRLRASTVSTRSGDTVAVCSLSDRIPNANSFFSQLCVGPPTVIPMLCATPCASSPPDVAFTLTRHFMSCLPHGI